MLELFISRLRSREQIERNKRLAHADKQRLEKRADSSCSPLHIVYILSHTSICGGVKVILQHANGLSRLGMRVTLVSHFPKPDWYPVEAHFITVPFQIELTRALPLCDVVVATYWEHIHACMEAGVAPVVYFEQGDFHLFEPDLNKKYLELAKQVASQFQLPPYIITVSRPVQDLIQSKFNRDSLVFPNALDCDIFYPKTTLPTKKYMMIVGSEKNHFKGTKNLIQALKLVQQQGYEIDLLWLSPDPPEKVIGEVHVNPPQDQIGNLYRKAFLFVCGSHYEAFSLPCLEAMACGTPVVTTRTPGVEEYAKDGVNCLMTEPRDVEGLSNRIIQLLENPQLYHQLQTAGYQTAAQYRWEHILPNLAEFYQEVAQERPIPKYKEEDWIFHFDEQEFLDADSSIKLLAFLSQTEANEVWGPVEYEILPNLPLILWKPLATRKTPLTRGFTDKLMVRAHAKSLPDCPWNQIMYKFISGKYLEAYAEAQKLLLQFPSDSREQGVIVRWAILCLIQMERYDEAKKVLAYALTAHLFYTDLFYLKATLDKLMGEEKQSATALSLCWLIQAGAYYPEHFDLQKILEHPCKEVL